MSNRWWEITVVCDPILEESVFWRLEKFGCSGTVTQVISPKQDELSSEENLIVHPSSGNGLNNTPVGEIDRQIRAYIAEVKANLLDLAALSGWLQQDAILIEAPEPHVRWQSIEEEDWSSSWKEHWQPSEIGDRFLIYPAWLEPPAASERLILRLDPGIAFGTGVHPTTQLCLESLEMRLWQDADKQRIADIGCGSGILALGAAMLGAKQVIAIDTDSLAIDASRQNCQLNQIARDRLIVTEGSLDLLLSQNMRFDGIVCNILAETILEFIPKLQEIATDESWAILSGIVLDQAQAIADAVEANGWLVAALWKRQDWCCFNIRRSLDGY